MSTTTEIPLDAIERFASRLPRAGAVDVTIEVLDEDLGDQIEVQRLPWHALVHDPKRDVVEVSVGGRGGVPVVFRHEISHPSHMWVEEDAGSIDAILIEPDDGPKTIVRFHERRALDAGS